MRLNENPAFKSNNETKTLWMVLLINWNFLKRISMNLSKLLPGERFLFSACWKFFSRFDLDFFRFLNFPPKFRPFLYVGHSNQDHAAPSKEGAGSALLHCCLSLTDLIQRSKRHLLEEVARSRLLIAVGQLLWTFLFLIICKTCLIHTKRLC